MTTDLTEQWYISLIEELADIITETGFTSRWALVEGYHQVGIRILQENDNFERSQIYGERICNAVAESLGKNTRTIYYAIQFAKTYPDLNLLPEGKNISWHHIVNKYLTTGEKKPAIKKIDLLGMIKEIKKLLDTEYLKAHQEYIRFYEDGNEAERHWKDTLDFIRYLQDQVNKITEGLE